MPQSNKNKSCMRVDESSLGITVWSKATIHLSIPKGGGGQSWPMDVIYYRLYYECPRSEGDVPIPGLTPFCAIKFEPVQSQW
jgi:hypothetical protein